MNNPPLDEHSRESSSGRRNGNGNIHRAAFNDHSSQVYSDSLDGGFDFLKIFQMFQKWWWLIALVVISAIGIALMGLSRATPMYKASTLLEVKQKGRNIVEVSDVESIIADKEFLTTQVELIKSRTLAEDVVDSLNLLSDSAYIDPENEKLSALTREQRRAIVTGNLRRGLSVSAIPRSRLINISFEHKSPRKATQIANAITETFIDNSLKQSFNSTAYAREFLEGRLLTVKKSLENAERQLVSYASDNDIINIDGNGSQAGVGNLDTMDLVTLNSKLTLATLERVSAESVYRVAKEAQVIPELLESGTLSDLKSKLTGLNSEYIEKSAIFKPNYPDMIELKSRIDLFEKQIDSETQIIVNSRLEKLKNNYELALSTESDLLSRVKKLKNSVTVMREKSIDYDILKRQVEIERSQYDALLQRLKDVSVSDEVGSNLVEVVDLAVIPRHPFKPRRFQVLSLALLLSLGFATVLIFLLEMLDNIIRTPEDVKNKLGRITMGVVPILKLDESKENDDEIEGVLRDPQSQLAEAYAALRTNIQFSGPDGGPRVIQITSTQSGEGKSTSSLGLAMRFAGGGEKVLLIDADMRRPTFVAKQNQSIGLSGLLTSRSEFENELVTTELENLMLLPAGQIVPNPSEILSTHRFDMLISWGRKNFDYIIVDSPPVLGLADAPLLGAKVDATVLVVESKVLRTPTVSNSIDRLLSSGTVLLGILLTKYVQSKSSYSYDYSYSYGEKRSKGAFKHREDKKSRKRKLHITENLDN